MSGIPTLGIDLLCVFLLNERLIKNTESSSPCQINMHFLLKLRQNSAFRSTQVNFNLGIVPSRRKAIKLTDALSPSLLKVIPFALVVQKLLARKRIN
jgi:hypothetical protein